MSPIRLPIRTLLLALAALSAHAQAPTPTAASAPPSAAPAPRKTHPRPSQVALNPNIVLLDPGHGGPDPGAKLGTDSLEKDTTVAFADRLRTVLAAHGFTVVLTHDSGSDQPTPDQRAELANHSRAATCLLLHATSSGHGVHLFTSSLTPPASTNFDGTINILPWDTAQATSIQQSLRLASELSDALGAIRLPLVTSHVSVPPTDSMTCPAVAIELAPLAGTDAPTLASDSGYQQRVVDAILTALVSWRSKLVDEAAAGQPAAPPAKPTPTPPAPARKPKPGTISIETPDIIPETPAAPKSEPKPAPKSVPQAGVPQ